MRDPLPRWCESDPFAAGMIEAMEDRRDEERYRLAEPPLVRFLVKPSFQSHWATVSDISRHGLGLVVCMALSPGDTIAVRLASFEAYDSIVRLGVVRHATPMVGRTWLIGCAMDDDLSDTEIWQLAFCDDIVSPVD